MGKQYKKLTNKDIAFIEKQKVFFMASASDKEVNLSPKGYDCIKLINDNTQVVYMDYPGSGNRTARDIAHNGEITIMFTAFDGPAQIVRLFCKGEIIDKNHTDFLEYISMFNAKEEIIRQCFIFSIYAVESSCGMSIPEMSFVKERDGIKNWAEKMSKNETLNGYIKDHEVPVDLHKID